MSIDEWTSVAAADDALVADLLLRLKHSGETWTATNTKLDSLSGALATFRWGRRKARSSHGATRFAMEKEYSKRASRSPTTPLSWSGGTSASSSGNADGYEASSMMCYGSPASRSKELANMHFAMAHNRNTRKNMKRIKRLIVHSKKASTSNAVEASTLHGMPSLFTPRDTSYDIPLRPEASISFDDVPAAKTGWESFMLPDLNMLPSIDEEPF